jgi:hypothetical protein
MDHKHQHGSTPVVEEHADDWHHHDPSSEGIPQEEHGGIASPAVIAQWYFGLVGAIAFSILVLAMYYGAYLEPLKKTRFEREGWAGLSQEAQDYKASSMTTLNSAGKLPDGHYRLPIDTAMDKVVEEYKARKSGK